MKFKNTPNIKFLYFQLTGFFKVSTPFTPVNGNHCAIPSHELHISLVYINSNHTYFTNHTDDLDYSDTISKTANSSVISLASLEGVISGVILIPHCAVKTVNTRSVCL